MIARIWHGRTPTSKADEYEEFLAQHAAPDYRSNDGNHTAYVLRRETESETHFLTLTFWESEASIEAFTGPDIDTAKYYSEDDSFLLEFEPTVTHYEVVSATGDGVPSDRLPEAQASEGEEG